MNTNSKKSTKKMQKVDPNHSNLPPFLVRDLIQFFAKTNYRPIEIQELMQALNVSSKYKRPFTKLLRDLAKKGVLVKLKRSRFAAGMNAHFLIGKLVVSSNGSAVKDAKSGRHVIIRPKGTGSALAGDEVLVRVYNHRYNPAATAKEGEVIRVIERNRVTLVGTLRKRRSLFVVEPQRTDRNCSIVIKDLKHAKLGDRVVVQVQPTEDLYALPWGEIMEVIGASDDPALDTLSIIKSYNLPTSFPEDVVQFAERITIKKTDLQGRLDLQKTTVFTIDPETAKDFDDAISLEKKRGGQWVLGVHIADVSHFIPAGSVVDKNALKRGNSVYFPDQVIPMLPEHLSNGLCSLKNDVTRLTVSVLMTLDDEAKPVKVKFYESAIKSRHQLNYGQVQSALDLPDGSALDEAGLDKKAVTTLKQIHRLAQKIRKHRFESGALHLDIPEIKFSINADGKIEGVIPTMNDEAHQLVEECMLLANEMVCNELTKRKIPHLHRIHDQPDPEKLHDLEESLRIAGFHVHDLTLREHLCELLATIADSAQAHAWNTAVLRSMKKAEYSEFAIGHYGLAKRHYTHFTSPIRRYSDLAIHRILKASLQKKKPVYTQSQLSEIAKQCSLRESISVKAERDVKDLKILRFFYEQIKSGHLQEYEAVVVDVQSHGLFIDIPEIQAYGMIHKSILPKTAYFNSFKKQFSTRGKNAIIFKIGTILRVVIAKVNLDKKFLDFAPVNNPSKPQKKKRYVR